jgi:hypothetical protein
LKYIWWPFNYFAVDIIGWLNKHFFHQPFWGRIPSSDNYLAIVTVFFCLILAVVIAFAWTLTEKGRKFPSFVKYSYTFARYYLAFILLIYAAYKFFGIQFDIPDTSLIMPLGTISAHTLFWNFMGASVSYSYFAGFLEFSAAALLLFRRTSTVGGIIALPVLINVLMLDAAYDTWLKLEVFSLVLFSLFILIPDVKSLFRFFVLKQNSSPPLAAVPLFESKKYKWLQYAIKLLFVVFTVLAFAKEQLSNTESVRDSPYSNIVGIHQIKDLYINGQAPKVAVNDSLTWTKFAIDAYSSLLVQTVNGSQVWYMLKVDARQKLLKYNSWTDTTTKYQLHYTSIKPNERLFEGMIKKDTVRFTTQRIDRYHTNLLKGYGKVKWLY